MIKLIKIIDWIIDAARCKLEKETANDIETRLKNIEKILKEAKERSTIAFGIAIIVIGWNFAITASAAGKTGVTVASILLIIFGFIIMAPPSYRGIRQVIRRIFKSKL